MLNFATRFTLIDDKNKISPGPRDVPEDRSNLSQDILGFKQGEVLETIIAAEVPPSPTDTTTRILHLFCFLC